MRPPIDLSQVRIVLFDVVGTLIQADPPVTEIYHRAGRKYGSQLTAAEIGVRFEREFRRHWDDAATDEAREQDRWRAIVTGVFDDVPNADEALFEELWSHFAEPQAWRVYDDVLPAWNRLERQGRRLGIASNFDGRLAALCRNMHPLDQALHVFYSSQLGYPKPALPFFRNVERQLGLSPHEILLVGDDVDADFHGARKAGWHAALVDRQSRFAGLPRIQSLADLPDLPSAE